VQADLAQAVLLSQGIVVQLQDYRVFETGTRAQRCEWEGEDGAAGRGG
jgi:hypothetical protein